MEIRNMFTPTKTITPPPAPLSARDRIAAELEYETGQLPELKLLVRFGRRPQDVVDAQELRIADLQRQLDVLLADEERERQVDAVRSTELPPAEAAIEAKLQDIVTKLVEVRRDVLAVREIQETAIARCADLKYRQRGAVVIPGLKNREAFALAGSANRLFQILTEEYESLSIFLKDARQAGLAVPDMSVAPTPVARVHKPRAVIADDIAARAQAASAQAVQNARAASERERVSKLLKRKAG